MTKDEALKLSLEVMRNQGDVSVDEWIATEKAIKEALAQRTWVGLIDEEWEMTHWSPDFRAGAKWAEAKLKEKNT